MRKTNHIAHGDGRAKHSSRGSRRGPLVKQANGFVKDAAQLATRLVPTDARAKQGVMAGAAALAATTAITFGYLGRRQIVRGASGATRRLGKWGVAFAIATGLRKKPLAMKLMPGIGIAAGMLAAGSAAIFYLPRVRARGEGEKASVPEAGALESGPELPHAEPGFSDRTFGAGSYNEHR